MNEPPTGPCLESRDLTRRFGGLTATDRLSLSVTRGDIHAIIGPNGAGKTTLVNLLSGLLRPDSGQILFDGHDITATPAPERVRLGLVRSFQITHIFREFSVLDNVKVSILARQGHAFRFWRPVADDPRLNEPARTILDTVGLLPRAGVRAGTLAHGEQRQLEIAIAMATGPSCLLLDEPMAGMGLEESRNMIRLLQRLKRQFTILLVEHDMGAVFALADRISVLVYGKTIATGTPEQIRGDARVQAAYLGEDRA